MTFCEQALTFLTFINYPPDVHSIAPMREGEGIPRQERVFGKRSGLLTCRASPTWMPHSVFADPSLFVKPCRDKGKVRSAAVITPVMTAGRVVVE